MLSIKSMVPSNRVPSKRSLTQKTLEIRLGLWPIGALRTSELGKYLDLWHFANRVLGLV